MVGYSKTKTEQGKRVAAALFQEIAPAGWIRLLGTQLVLLGDRKNAT